MMEDITSIYSMVLFLHIAGAIGFFVVQGVEWMGLSQIRSAQYSEEARPLMRLVKKTDRLGGISMLTTMITGVYMTLTVWKGVAWLLVMLGALALEILLFVALARPRMAAMEQALTMEKGPVSQSFHNLANNPFLWISIHTRTAILLGIVALKVAKPDLGGSLLTVAIAIAAGLASVLPVLRHEREQAGRADRMIVTLLVTAFVAALVLLAAKTISASNIPMSRTEPGGQAVQTEPAVAPADISNQTPAPSPETAPQEGQLLLEARCAQCHSLRKVLKDEKTRAEWEETLAEMESYNVKLSDTEKNVLLDYLTSGSASK